jgi:HAD superfamily hydrolase (TIGR01549 family)
MTDTIDTIIFDWGGVLIDDPAQGLVDYCADHLDITPERLKPVLDAHLTDFQKLRTSENEMWDNITSELRINAPTVESLWGDAFRDVYKEKEEMFDLAKRLKENGYTVGFLSNTELPAMNFFYEMGYGTIFQSPIFSCAVNKAKPEKDIYLLTAKNLGISPESAVFIDDRTNYLEGAKEAGMETILYESTEQVKTKLTELGINTD